jgi:integrase
MSPLLPKLRSIRRDAEAYHKLQRQILERDGWRCQLCGSLSGLEVHHIQRRSRSGADSEENLITLCSDCHAYYQIWRVYQKAAKAAGIGGLGTHSLRHTYRSWLDSVGTPVGAQQKLMRHADIRTTMNVYGHANSTRQSRRCTIIG